MALSALCVLRRAAPLACAAVALGGCGSSTSAMSAEAHFVEFAKGLCTHAKHPVERDAAMRRQLHAEGERLHDLMLSARKAPRVARLMSDVAERRRAKEALEKLARTGTRSGSGKGFSWAFFGHAAGHPFELLSDSYGLSVKVYDDEKALGISCISPAPRKPIAG